MRSAIRYQSHRRIPDRVMPALYRQRCTKPCPCMPNRLYNCSPGESRKTAAPTSHSAAHRANPWGQQSWRDGGTMQRTSVSASSGPRCCFCPSSNNLPWGPHEHMPHIMPLMPLSSPHRSFLPHQAGKHGRVHTIRVLIPGQFPPLHQCLLGTSGQVAAVRHRKPGVSCADLVPSRAPHTWLRKRPQVRPRRPHVHATS